MKLVIFEKENCEACRNAKTKIDFFLDKWGVADSLDRQSINVSTSDGLVEAAMQEVADIPTIILERDGEEVARWSKKAPKSEELRSKLGV
jgi:hypothetical protein